MKMKFMVHDNYPMMIIHKIIYIYIISHINHNVIIYHPYLSHMLFFLRHRSPTFRSKLDPLDPGDVHGELDTFISRVLSYALR